MAEMLPTIISFDEGSRILTISEFQQICIISVSGHALYSIHIQNLCQTVAGISSMGQFQQFSKPNFRRVWAIWPNCVVCTGVVG